VNAPRTASDIHRSRRPTKSPLPAHAPLPWRAVHVAGQSFIYTEAGTLICVVTSPLAHEVAPAGADFIICACRHHHELARLVESAVHILADGSEVNIALGFGISRVRVEEFFRQAGQILHAVHVPHS
jgi:hypothetical protein